ncbi:flagellar hook assembly protein FlgD [Tropicibacter sp. R16_0]|uniref:flagellar hook capping FlgD N-terminal domain-containing protein n=1 Tax=Tropicibacter sp. R16_0 TaxID=2821102 RepID=UPI001ADB3FB7|nr:flagellar hook capping FlgD N-terminal domain-containing protein [Tropicibacter sp. R16_0]MBO9450556.1 flagellar hook assembly protein FlgD [Tropicibacter sp. R16_0]
MITETTQSNGTNTSATNTSSSSKAPQIATDFETFLRMLTVQAQNQDPLEPLDSSEYAAQLAQFSMVEQQTKTNQTLEALVNKLGGNPIAELSNWIGKEARAVAPANYTGQPITVSPSLHAEATEAVLVVRNTEGTVVERKSIPVSSTPFEWTGLDEAGTARPSGLYSFAVESRKDGTVLNEQTAAVYNDVIEAQVQNGEVTLILEGGQAILASNVTAVRAQG